MARDSIISRLEKWHDEDEHQKIIDAIEAMPRNTWNYELSGLYARALNNRERYEEALKILLPLEEAGREDGVWYFRVGYALYYLDREAEAAEYFQKAIDYGDDGEDTHCLLELSLEAAERKQQGESGGYAPELYSDAEVHCIEAHIEKRFGQFEHVFHEMVSPDIHVDIVIIEPVPERNYYVLVTMGMGAHRMDVPEELKDLERAELVLCLPPEWNLQDVNDENWYWPLRWLKILSRLPLEQDTWLGWGHTVPNGGPFADNTRFTTMMLLNPGAFAEDSCACTLPGGSRVNFYQMIPLYEEEADYKIQNGAEKLLEYFDDELLEYIKLDRKNSIETSG
ncbi:MAG: suppressor of fused domain protein [Treponema sp.]|jgi:tetratricopeptide (TPR) repeat protein|nr:suppressor of fused domain protein [Treponema sp.]